VADRDPGHDAEADRLSETRIEPWAEGDLPLLERIMGDPAMTEHLGGPEPPEKIVERQGRYERMTDPATGRMFKIVDAESGEGVGSVGYWERPEGDGTVYETGWLVLPEFQGRGIATTATAQCIERARAERRHQYLHAYPSVENHASNAICRKLGFELVGVEEYEYPKNSGNIMRCNDFRLDLFAEN
jgi:RimJ/RimL family protein N-acetyltransferase